MLDCNPISDILYLIAKQEEKEAAAEGRVTGKSSLEEREAAVKSGKKVWQGKTYYDDHESAEADGVLWRPILNSAAEAKILQVEAGKEPRVGRGRRLADGLVSGSVVSTKAVRKLSMGFDAVSGEKLTKAADWHLKRQRYPEKVGKKPPPRAGYDVTFSPDKPVSLLWADAMARGDTKMATAIENALRGAVNDAKQYAFDNSLVKTRKVTFGDKGPDGKKERIEYVESAVDMVTADYLHRTTRPAGDGSTRGDCQLHIHSLWFNTVTRADGSVAALDDGELYFYKPVLDALMKVSLYGRLRQIDGLQELDFIRGDKDIKIKGIQQDLVDAFSNRRSEIKAALAERNLTTADRRAAQIAAKATRMDKVEQPPISELVGDWRKVIHQFTDGESLLSKLEARQEADESRDEKIARVCREAIGRISHTQTIIDERDVLASIYRSSQGEFSLDEMPELVSALKQNHLIQAGYDDDGRAMWGVLELVKKERSFMNMCLNLPEMSSMANEEQIAAILEKYRADPDKGIRGLNDEQKAGIRVILESTSAISILEGSAGAGKSFTSGRINEVLAGNGISTIGISPSWKATDVLRKDMNLSDDMAKACAKFEAEVRSGKLKIDANTVVVVDEAGMCGIESLEFIAKVVTENSGRLILTGDSQQLSPVAAGSPLTMARDVLGSHRLNQIMRQNDPDNPERSERYRKASGLFVKGKKEDIAEALGIYRDEGRIQYAEDLQFTYHAAADWYLRNYDAAKPQETLITTKRNSDLHAINEEVRASMIEAGHLGEEEVSFDSIRRNDRGKESSVRLHLRAGDRVIFGERLETRKTGLEIPINNSDQATVKGVSTDPETGEAIIELAFDKAPDNLIRAKASQLVGHRKEGEKLLPQMNHAYCVTVYGSQGETVKNSLLVNCHGSDFRSTYVAMTRHTHQADLIVNIERIEQNKAVKAGIILVEENNHISIPDKEDLRQNIPPEEFKYGPDEWFAYICHEAAIADQKANFSDLPQYEGEEKLKAWLADENWELTHLESLQNVQLDKIQSLDKIIDNKARLEGKIGASLAADQATINNLLEGSVQPFRDLKPSSSTSATMETLTPNQEGTDMDQKTANSLRNRMLKFKLPTKDVLDSPPTIDDAKAAAKAAQKIEKVSKRISDAERDFMRMEDPRRLVERLGYTLVREHKGGGGYDFCENMVKGEPTGRFSFKSMTGNGGDGGWSYIRSNDPSKRGAIWSWMVDYGHASSVGDGMHKLREEFRTEHLQDTQIVSKPPVAEKPKSTYQAYKDTIADQLMATSFKDDGRGLSGVERLQEAIAKGAEADAAYIDTFRGRIADKWLKVIENGTPDTASPADRYKAEKALELLDKGASYYDFHFKHQMQTPWATDKYPKERGLERATLLAFDGDVKRDVYKDAEGWKMGMAFAHRDVVNYSTITGYESKLPASKTADGENRRTAQFVESGGKGLVMLGPKAKGSFNEVVITESGIDCLSYWQEKKLPANFKQLSDTEKQDVASRVPKETLMLATGGQISDQAFRGIELLAKANPQAKFVVAMDNDFAGYAFREQVKEAVLRGNPKAEVKFQQPASILYKDWNDQVRNKVRSPEDLQKSADKMGLSSDFIKREVATYQQKNPQADLSGYQGIGSKAADEKAKQAAQQAEQKRVQVKDAPSIQPTLPAFKPFKFQPPKKPAGISAEDVKRAEEARLKAEEERKEAERRRGATMKM